MQLFVQCCGRLLLINTTSALVLLVPLLMMLVPLLLTHLAGGVCEGSELLEL